MFMFLRVKRSKKHAYLVLVENFYDEGRVRQRTIHHFGRLDRTNPLIVRQILSKYPGFRYLRVESDPVISTDRSAPHGANLRAPPAASLEHHFREGEEGPVT